MNNRFVEKLSAIVSRRVLNTLALCALAMIVPERAAAQDARSSDTDFPGNEFVKVRLALENTAIAPAGTTNLAVIFDIAPGWHLYWRNPGDSGLPPKVSFTPIPGVALGAAQWPVPVRRIEKGGLLDYIHERELVLVFPITTTSGLAGDTNLNIRAEIDWLVCKDRCVQGRAHLSKSWRIAAGAKPSGDARVFEAARRRRPRPASNASKPFESTWNGLDLLLTAKGAGKLTFFPYENEEDVYPEDMIRSGESKTDSLRMHYAPDVTNLKQVAGVLAITRGGVETSHVMTVSPPPAKDSIVDKKGGRASGKE